MATEKRYLALDMGAESGRGVVGSLADGKLTLEEVHRFGNGPTTVDGSLHWDVQNQAAELRNAIAAAHAKCGAIESVGVDTWGVDYGLLDEAGELLGDPYHYRDSRTDGAEAVAFEIMPRADIYGLTGIQFMQLNTLFQLFAESRADAEKLARAKDLLFMPDLFNYLLTGEKATEYSIATTSQLLDARTGQWSAPLFERLGLPIDIMQQIVPTGTQVGQLLESIAEETGAGRLPVIAPATHDTGSAVAAVPAAAGGENWAYLSSGTWSLMGVELDSPIITPETLELSITNEGGVNNTIRFLKNIMGLWLVQECRRQWQQDGQPYTYDQITQYAAESPAFLSFVNPNDASFAGIGHMPGRIQAFCRKTGQKIPDNHGELTRCALESLALCYRQVLGAIERITDRKIDALHIVGGGSQNRLLNQFAANACGVPVVTGPVEATAMGNILVQAIAQGEVADLDEARAIVRASCETETFEPQEAGKWNDAYERYLKLV